ncbi:peptide chain release factor N(5)-glutamine methyltransferase [candidate division WS5 bacterium]|uniref:Peptide chain release factor N(5)-glutamine methyltransferase n=1 Tax=candidate division WS5 bacterium TaxID=2093353 RepID=A0A419DG99_9BACT|nr:MAG: peptide chain release factor N(5)-glutamine methyltransferase [candidate division WS5 bacterium]
MNVKIALLKAAKELKILNVSEPEKSAEFLLRQVLAPSLCHSRPPLSFPRRRESLRRINSGGNPDIKAWMLANPEYELSPGQEKKFFQYIERRKRHEPVWYITGKIEFYGLDLFVDESVLIPRPETELLVEEVLAHLSLSSRVQVEGSLKKTKGRGFLHSSLCDVGRNDNIRILELGTGSGAISLAIANALINGKERLWTSQNDVQFFASDISGDALKIAKKNTKKLRLDSRSGSGMTGEGIEFRRGDLLKPWLGEKFDIIAANLPYIPHEDIETLALDIHHWEPRVALDGGKEGLEIYERLLFQAKDYVNQDAIMFFEIGINQGEKLKKLVRKYLPDAKVTIKKDYSNIDRIAVIKTKNGKT